MTKKLKYEQLIKKARDYYMGFRPELHNLFNGDCLYDLEWFPPLKEEINLWTYWQGRGNLDSAEIVLLGQDFGSYKENDEVQPFLLECLKNQDSSSIYIDAIKKNRNKTDNNLIELFNVLGDEYRADEPNIKLFFTNLCLGYRSISKGSQGNLSSQMKHDTIYIKELIDIIKPKVVICLGSEVFVSLVTGLNNIDYQEQMEAIRSDYYKSLNEKKNHMTVFEKDFSYELFAMGHPGHFGVINRKKYSNKSDCLGIELMKDDWKKIKEYL